MVEKSIQAFGSCGGCAKTWNLALTLTLDGRVLCPYCVGKLPHWEDDGYVVALTLSSRRYCGLVMEYGSGVDMRVRLYFATSAPEDVYLVMHEDEWWDVGSGKPTNLRAAKPSDLISFRENYAAWIREILRRGNLDARPLLQSEEMKDMARESLTRTEVSKLKPGDFVLTEFFDYPGVVPGWLGGEVQGWDGDELSVTYFVRQDPPVPPVGFVFKMLERSRKLMGRPASLVESASDGAVHFYEPNEKERESITSRRDECIARGQYLGFVRKEMPVVIAYPKADDDDPWEYGEFTGIVAKVTKKQVLVDFYDRKKVAMTEKLSNTVDGFESDTFGCVVRLRQPTDTDCETLLKDVPVKLRKTFTKLWGRV